MKTKSNSIEKSKKLDKKNVEFTKNSMERKYKIDYSTLSAHEQKTKRTSIRNKMLSYFNSIILHGELKKDKEQLNDVIKAFKKWNKETYMSEELNVKKFLNSNNVGKNSEIERGINIIQNFEKNAQKAPKAKKAKKGAKVELINAEETKS